MCRLTKEMVMEAIPGRCGIISVIAKQCNCSWHTVKQFLDEPVCGDIIQLFIEEREAMLDIAENHLMKPAKRFRA